MRPSRSTLVLTLALLLLGLELPSPVRAETDTGRAWGVPWTRVPSVTVVVDDRDDRDAMVSAAVAFWNGQFAEIGSPFRLGPISHLYGSIPVDKLADVSRKVRSDTDRPELSISITRWEGNIVVALSNGAFKSFTARWPKEQKALVGIRRLGGGPLAIESVARNVIAHEIGHAVGLGHNNSPGTLMCGPRESCRLETSASKRSGYLPLTDKDKATMKRLYPADWKSR